jgi:hypothetical protein
MVVGVAETGGSDLAQAVSPSMVVGVAETGGSDLAQAVYPKAVSASIDITFLE